jgi:hypothetical protein
VKGPGQRRRASSESNGEGKITAIVRNFWWRGISSDKNSRALCLKAWADICSPKKKVVSELEIFKLSTKA